MKKQRTYLIGLLLLLLPYALQAQVEKAVEVSKSYIPQVATATKPMIEPNLTDTVKIRPEIDYNILPRALNTSYTAQTFRPATVTYWEFNRPSPYYLKLGMGYPLQSEADLYLSAQHGDIGYASLYLNHEGEYDKRRNDADLKESALSMDNRIGVAAGRYLGRQILEGELYYDNRLRSRYGASNPEEHYMVGERINFGEAGLSLRIGTDIEDEERVNFSIEGYGRYFYDNSGMPQPREYNQMDGGGEGSIRFRWGKHRLGLHLNFNGVWGMGDLSHYNNLSYGGGLRYTFSTRLIEAEVGADYLRTSIRSMESKKSHNYILPYAHLHFNLGEGAFVPFIELDGEMRGSDFRSLSLENPYLKSGLALDKNWVDYHLRLGAMGEISSKFHYRLTLSLTCSENAHYWYGMNFPEQGDSNYLQFGVAQARRDQLSIGLNLGWRPTSGLLLSWETRASHYKFSAWRGEHKLGGGLPALTSTLKAEYESRRIRIGASARVESVRNWSNLMFMAAPRNGGSEAIFESTTYHLPITIDLRCWFDCRISQAVTLYVEGENLTNSRLYEWANYPLQGIGFMAGVRLTF